MSKPKVPEPKPDLAAKAKAEESLRLKNARGWASTMLRDSQSLMGSSLKQFTGQA